MKQTQCKRILQYINKFGSITTYEAFADLGVARLASRICDLKKQGYDIKSDFVTTQNRFNEPVSFKRYYLDKGA